MLEKLATSSVCIALAILVVLTTYHRFPEEPEIARLLNGLLLMVLLSVMFISLGRRFRG